MPRAAGPLLIISSLLLRCVSACGQEEPASRPDADMAEPLDMRPDQAALPDLSPDLEVEDAGRDGGAPQEMGADMAAPDMGPDPRVGHCEEVERFGPVFAPIIDTWTRQDDLSAPWPAPVVFVGSSTMRRWEGLARDYSAYNPVQRGFGGAQLGEVAYYADALISRHDPRAVVVFAGTNDIAADVAPEIVVGRLRCLRERIGLKLGWERPVVFIGVTPTPSRWDKWPQARAVNEAVAALAEDDPGLHYVDVPAAFLRTGEPPADNLFVADRLHLSPAGYALWQSVLGPAIARIIAPAAPLVPQPLAAGERILIDLGPSNPEDGQVLSGPDGSGRRWNSWHPVAGGVAILPGERLSRLITAAGEATGVELIISGGFIANGLRNGGLTNPSSARLGSLAVPSATSDFFYADGDDSPGALYLSGLDPARRYTLRLFAARASDERRVTSYVVAGATSQAVSLQTSGPGAGAAGGDTNDHRVVELTGASPDAAGHLFIDVRRVEGQYAYLSLIELVVE